MDDAAVPVLALGVREGDQEAASRLVRGTQQQVWRMLVALSDRGIAEDLTQETYARAIRALPSFRAESTVREWLLSIARRVAADHPRARARPRTDPDVPVEDAGGAVVAGDYSESVALHSVVARLDPERRLAFVLTQIPGGQRPVPMRGREWRWPL